MNLITGKRGAGGITGVHGFFGKGTLWGHQKILGQKLRAGRIGQERGEEE